MFISSHHKNSFRFLNFNISLSKWPNKLRHWIKMSSFLAVVFSISGFGTAEKSHTLVQWTQRISNKMGNKTGEKKGTINPCGLK